MEQQNSFQLLKEKLTIAPILNYLDFQGEILVTTDASDYDRQRLTDSIRQQNFMQGRTKLYIIQRKKN